MGPSQFTVMIDRSQGGASLNDGQLELMVSSYILFATAIVRIRLKTWSHKLCV